MLRKRLILCLVFFELGFPVVAVIAAEFNSDQTAMRGLGQAYGFVCGQDITLERIKKEFTEFAPAVTIAKAQFSESFPNIKSKLKERLVTALGKELFDKTDLALKKQLLANLRSQLITRELAREFLEQVKERAEGKMDSPFIEYMLAVQYQSFPAGEFFDGYLQRFNSDGHRKAQGLKISLQVPKSWKAKVGERPHIVQKWISRNGARFGMIHLDIRETEGYAPTDDEVEAFVASGLIRDEIPQGASYMNSGLFSSEGRTGYWMEMTMLGERIDIDVYLHSLMYQLFFRGKAIGLTCQIADEPKNRIRADERFETLKPLCQQVLNSLVLLQAY